MVTLDLEALERRRLAAGLSRVDVGKAAGIAPSTRRRIFGGKPVRMVVLRRVAGVFGVEPGELIDVDRELAAIEAAR